MLETDTGEPFAYTGSAVGAGVGVTVGASVGAGVGVEVLAMGVGVGVTSAVAWGVAVGDGEVQPETNKTPVNAKTNKITLNSIIITPLLMTNA
jgi:hypothetical protein